MIYVNSSAVHATFYNINTATLTIWFQQGDQGYDFYRVPEAVFRGLVTANSPGTYYNEHIRGRYSG